MSQSYERGDDDRRLRRRSAPSGQTYARYVTVDITEDLHADVRTKWAGANSDGSYTLHGNSRDEDAMRKLVALRRDERGAAAIELAFALPVLIADDLRIFELGIAGQAIAGMQHALGEGARFATLCLSPTASGVQRADRRPQIKAQDEGEAVRHRRRATVRPIRRSRDSGSDGLRNYHDLTVTYTQPMNFLFFSAGRRSRHAHASASVASPRPNGRSGSAFAASRRRR